jgi:hypothetical protein
VTVRSLAILLLAAGLATGQGAPPKKDAPKEPAKPAPGSLEDTLEKALRNSADIKAAEAKVRDAEAQLSQVRQQVLLRATSLHTDLNQAKRMVTVLDAALREQMRLYETKLVSREAIVAAEVAIEKQKGEVEKLEAELKSLRGEFAVKAVTSAAFSPDGRLLYSLSLDEAARVWDAKTGQLLADPRTTSSFLAGSFFRGNPAAAVQPTMAERIRALLGQEVELTGNPALGQAVGAVLTAAKSEVPVRTILNQVQSEMRADLPKGKLPVGAWIQAIEDTDAKVVVVVRDYGLLVTMKDRVPDGAVRVAEFWKAKPKEEPKSEKK